MSTKQSPALQLAEGQLTKLTSESEEIRMRALDQIETRFIRCLQLGEPIQFKPVLLLKQLIRWFGYTPPLVPCLCHSFAIKNRATIEIVGFEQSEKCFVND